LAVDLRVIGGEQSKRNAQPFAKELSKDEGELRISIGYNEAE